MPVIDEIRAFHDELTEWRRDIHAHPELGFQEQRTSDLVADKLAQWGALVENVRRFGACLFNAGLGGLP